MAPVFGASFVNFQSKANATPDIYQRNKFRANDGRNSCAQGGSSSVIILDGVVAFGVSYD